jgi:hypothetical protein
VNVLDTPSSFNVKFVDSDIELFGSFIILDVDISEAVED